MSDEDWKKKLTPEQFHVLRQKGTEMPGTGRFVLPPNEDVIYSCAACGNQLFSTSHQYESTTPGLVGWPSFSDAANAGSVELKQDDSLGMLRTEVVCKKCGGHLGHLFDDENSPNGKHFCINSVCLEINQ